MIKKLLLTCVTLIFSKHIALAQTITLQPDAASGKDAYISDWPTGNYQNTNFGTYSDYDAVASSAGGVNYLSRGLLQFDLSSIPANAVIISAQLSLYNNPTSQQGTHYAVPGPNDSRLERITSNWDENTVTWNTQPSTTIQNAVNLPPSSSPNEDYLNISVTNLVTDMMNNPGSSFGFMYRLNTEQPYNKMVFASSDHSDPAKRPKLVITYYTCFPLTLITLQPDAASGKDAYISDWSAGNYQNTNFGTYPDYDAIASTAGSEYHSRGLLQFDLSSVPANAVIISAQLSLFNNPTSQQGTHYAVPGPNDSRLERITSDWDENTVTWNTQPSTTLQNAVNLAPSTSPNQDYLNIDVTNLLMDMINNPGSSFGFMYRLNTEQPYNKMVFASSDYSDPSKHPMLTISYFNPTIVANGATTFCSGGSVLLSANSGTGLTYQWKKNNSNISGATASSYSASTAGSYTVVISNSCGSSVTSSAVTVTVNPLPTVSFSGLAATYNVSDPAAALTGSPPGGVFTGPGISGNTFNPSSAGVGGPYTIVYSYTDGNGCSNSSSQTTTVLNCTIPAMPSSINGATAPCANSTGKAYSCPAVSGATSYAWTVPSSATIVSGQGTTSITVNFGSTFTSGVIGVSASNCGGSSAQKTKNIFGIPATPGTITGQKTGVCAGTSNVPYSIPGVGGASTYTWTAPANATIISGQGTTAIVVNYNASFTSGTLSVTAGNTCGTSAVKSATIRAIPPTPGAISGPTTFCGNQQGVAYSIAAVSGATTYNWLVPTGAIVATGQGTASITVNFGTKNGKVKVSAGNACGFSAYKQLNVTKNCREGFDATETENTIKVYPNPSSGDFVFEISNIAEEKITINIYDMIGKSVLSKVYSEPQFTIGNPQLTPGIYSAEIIYGENKRVLKLIKTK